MSMLDPDNPDSGRTLFNRHLMDRCIEVFLDWIDGSRTRLGADVKIATKDVRVTDRDSDSVKTVKITAYSVCEKYDPKTANKDLFFSLPESLLD